MEPSASMPIRSCWRLLRWSRASQGQIVQSLVAAEILCPLGRSFATEFSLYLTSTVLGTTVTTPLPQPSGPEVSSLLDGGHPALPYFVGAALRRTHPRRVNVDLRIYANRHTIVQQSLDRGDGMRCAAGAIRDCRQIARRWVATPRSPLV